MSVARRFAVTVVGVLLIAAVTGCSAGTPTSVGSDGAPTVDRATVMAQGPEGQLTYTDGTYTVFAPTDGEYYSAVYENVGEDRLRLVDLGTEYGYAFTDDDSRLEVTFGGATYVLEQAE
jgi:hypothetical protein